jgi:hypothetical protein
MIAHSTHRWNHPSLTSLLVVVILALGIEAIAVGADQAAQSGAEESGKRVSLTRNVEPSFRAEPVVHRFQGRRGEVIPFKFELASTGKVMNVDVRPVNLRQEETGIILHDETSELNVGVEFDSPTQFQLRPGEKFSIEGKVTVPLTKSNYVSFGILVRDSGQISGGEGENLEPGQTRAAIRFVTQYVLRVDIETGAQDVGDMKQLTLENGELIARDGLPFVRVFLNNPTADALECDVRAEVHPNGSAGLTPVRLNMPSRSELTGDDRYLVRIMPRSRLRLEGPVDEVVPNGHCDLNVRLSNGRRMMAQAVFPTEVLASSFRGLAARVATSSSGLSIEPAQIEMGRAADTNRMETLQFVNRGGEPTTVQLLARDHEGNLIDDVMLSSKKFTLEPGRSKSVRAMLRGRTEMSYQWGRIDVVSGEADTIESVPLALSLIHGQRPELNFAADELQWAQLPDGTAFTMKVTNQGAGYAPLFAELKLAAPTGHPAKLSDGFGQWLAPGQVRELQFRIPDSTQPGPYQITLDVRSAEEHVIAQRTLMLELTAEMLARAAEQVATRP